MSTLLHRLQISLPRWQVQFLTERARRDKVSLAEVIRQMIQREANATPTQASVDSLMEIAGLAEDRAPLVEGIPVSERPDLYLAQLSSPRPSPPSNRSRARVTGREKTATRRSRIKTGR
jgi:hypothetical protein